MTPSVRSSDRGSRPGDALLGFLHEAIVSNLVFYVASHFSPAASRCHLPPPPCHNLFETHFLSDIGFEVAASIVHGKAINLHFGSVALVTCLRVLGTEMGHAAHPQLKWQGKGSALFSNHLVDDIFSLLLGYRNYDQLTILLVSATYFIIGFIPLICHS